MSLADTLVARAIECDGLSYGKPETRRAYLLHQYNGDVTFEGEPDDKADNMGSAQYGCILHGRGVLAGDEVDGLMTYRRRSVDILRCAYAPFIGEIETMMANFAKERGLFVDRGEGLCDVQPADLIIIGMGGQAPKDPDDAARWRAEWGGVAHGVFVTEVAGNRVRSVDGGQTDAANRGRGTAIKACERHVEMRGGHPWLVSPRDARRINWRLRCAELPLRSKP